MKKIKAGTLYKGNDSDLLYLKESTARLLYSINTSSPDERVKIHTDLFPRLFKRLGKNTWFETPFNCDYGQYIEIGENCYFNHHCSIGDGGKVVIGNNVIIGAGSVVTRNISANTLAYGVPCREIRKL